MNHASITLGREKRRAAREKLEMALLLQLRASNLPEPVFQYRFHPKRRWKFDVAWPDLKLAVEVQGGTFVNGKHSRGVGYAKDCEKLAAAMELGWAVFQCETTMVRTGQAVQAIERLVEVRKNDRK